MNGPFTTITVELWYKMQDVVRAAERFRQARSADDSQAIAEAELYRTLDALGRTQ